MGMVREGGWRAGRGAVLLMGAGEAGRGGGEAKYSERWAPDNKCSAGRCKTPQPRYVSSRLYTPDMHCAVMVIP